MPLDTWIGVGQTYEWEEPQSDADGTWYTLRVDEIWVDEDGTTHLRITETGVFESMTRRTSLTLEDLFEPLENGELSLTDDPARHGAAIQKGDA